MWLILVWLFIVITCLFSLVLVFYLVWCLVVGLWFDILIIVCAFAVVFGFCCLVTVVCLLRSVLFVDFDGGVLVWFDVVLCFGWASCWMFGFAYLFGLVIVGDCWCFCGMAYCMWYAVWIVVLIVVVLYVCSSVVLVFSFGLFVA